MTETESTYIDQIASLLADKGYEVAPHDSNLLTIKEPGSGITIRAVLEGNILYLSLVCLTARTEAITPEMMRRMLSAENGVSTSYFQLYDTGHGETAVTLNNFCTLLDMGAEDQDDILSCAHYLLVDVMTAHDVLGELLEQASA